MDSVQVSSSPSAASCQTGAAAQAGVVAEPVIRVSIVEDDRWIREALADHINGSAGFRCVSAYATAEEALAGLPAQQPSVVLMDINLPKMNGVECVWQLKRLLPEASVLMLTVYEESDRIFDSLKAGADGYLLKRTMHLELLDAIAQVQRGGSPMSGLIARKVVHYFSALGRTPPELETLSPREREILKALGEGAAYKEIADKLGLSIDTIRMHIRSTYAKLHVHSRGEAVAKYLPK